jgi:Tfp pilus assembly protein PilN
MPVMINLLPDIRQQKLRDAEKRQLLGLVMTTVLIVCGVLVGGMFVITAAQSARITSLTKSIAQKQSQISNDTDLPKVLTAQQQIVQLGALLKRKVYVSKLFAVLSEVSPSPKELAVSSMTSDDTGLLTAKVTAKSFYTATRAVAALAASNISVGSKAQSTNTPDFSNISLSAVDSDTSGIVSFTVTMQPGTGVTNAQR